MGSEPAGQHMLYFADTSIAYSGQHMLYLVDTNIACSGNEPVTSRGSCRKRSKYLLKSQTLSPPGLNLSPAEAIPGRVRRGRHDQARRGRSVTRGGPPREETSKRLETWSKDHISEPSGHISNTIVRIYNGGFAAAG